MSLSGIIWNPLGPQWQLDATGVGVDTRAGVKYVLSNTNTNTNTNTFFPEFQIQIQIQIHRQKSDQIQIQIQIQLIKYKYKYKYTVTRAETKLPPFYRWQIKIYFIVLFIQISLKIVSKGPIYNKPTLVQIMAWRWVGNKPLSDQWWPSFLMHKCITRPKWVNVKCSVADCYLNAITLR